MKLLKKVVEAELYKRSNVISQLTEPREESSAPISTPNDTTNSLFSINNVEERLIVH